MYYNDRPPSPDTAAEKQWRKDEYVRLRTALSLPRAELSRVTGLKITTLNQLPYSGAPSLIVLERMREALEDRQAA